jgi:rRNA maturation endonuclease Nob1
MTKQFSIYGDNIVECERMLSLVKKAFSVKSCSVSGSPTAPIFELTTPKGIFQFNCFPGFCRWEHDIVSVLQNAGGVLRETPDIFITKIEADMEVPILAVEFCSALPAGNQAWQRSGRAYSTAKCGIPYLFITELGGFELDVNRNKKAPRLPNPAVPYSFISYAESSDADLMIAYEMNPGADEENRIRYSPMIAGNDLSRYIAAKILGEDSDSVLEALATKAYSFVQVASDNKKIRVASLSTEQWNRVHDALHQNGNAQELYNAYDFEWKKKLSIETKPSFQRFLSEVEKIATAVASGDLPFCVIKRERVPDLKKAIKRIYPGFFDCETSVNEIGTESVAICWINGFKPHGDDARPDRGQLPFLRMLIGDDIKVITVVYGPATTQMLAKLSQDPKRLGEENGLWESILALSNFVICDSMRGDKPVFQKGWIDTPHESDMGTALKMPANKTHFPRPECIGENDVDSGIHMLFAYVLKADCFESMCNPPGGDWSGISLRFKGKEYRWLTLPRVSASGSKRPDHVIQSHTGEIITIESKDSLRNLEKNIGKRLNQYCIDLFKTPPSCTRETEGNWSDQIGTFVLPDLTYVSVGAFLEKSDDDSRKALPHAKTDIAFLISFKGQTAIMKIKFATDCNIEIKKLLSNIKVPKELNLQVDIID